MKTNIIVSFLVAGILIVGAGAGAYFLLPALIQEKTAALNSQLKKTEERLQKLEAYIASEEKANSEGQLKIGADPKMMIKALNRQNARIDALESKISKGMKSIDEGLVKQRNRIDEGLKEQAESSRVVSAEAKAFIRTTTFNSLLNNIKGQILKARLALSDKNISAVRNELDLVDNQFDKARGLASDQQKADIEKLHEMLGNVKTDLDINLASAANRLDLLWHELGKLSERK